MDDPGDAAVLVDEGANRRLVGDIQTFELKAAVFAETVQARLLQGNVVVIIEVVGTDDFIAPL